MSIGLVNGHPDSGGGVWYEEMGPPVRSQACEPPALESFTGWESTYSHLLWCQDAGAARTMPVP